MDWKALLKNKKVMAIVLGVVISAAALFAGVSKDDLLKDLCPVVHGPAELPEEQPEM